MEVGSGTERAAGRDVGVREVTALCSVGVREVTGWPSGGGSRRGGASGENLCARGCARAVARSAAARGVGTRGALVRRRGGRGAL